jgi:uncharacterized protein YwgA
MNESRKRALVRKAVLAELTKRVSGKLGRTGVMKMMYLLQAVKGVELGYSFRLYNYGPYDGQVLDDLNIAEREGVVRSEAFEWQGGSGYVIKSGQNSEQVLQQVQDELKPLDNAIGWVTTQFGNRSASDLEVLSTIIFVDQACKEAGETIRPTELAKRVHEIKPHHAVEKITAELQTLQRGDLLSAVS